MSDIGFLIAVAIVAFILGLGVAVRGYEERCEKGHFIFQSGETMYRCVPVKAPE